MIVMDENGIHYCNQHPDYGDWSINGKTFDLDLNILRDKLRNRQSTKVKFSDIAWQYSQYTFKDTGFIQNTKAYKESDVSEICYLVQNADNPDGRRYRLVSGNNTMLKMYLEHNMTEADFYVFSNKEFLNALGEGEESKIAHTKTLDYYGFPVAVYDYLNHSEVQDELIKEVFRDDIFDPAESHPDNPRKYKRSDKFDNNFLGKADSSTPFLQHLKSAYKEAIEHFYYDLHSLSFFGGGKPQITQSWVVQPDKDLPTGNALLEAHTHFMSFVCGAYYLSMPKDKGGNICFHNPSWFKSQLSASYFVKMLYSYGFCETGPIPEFRPYNIKAGEIVLWSNMLPHSVESICPDFMEERISIIVNSCPDVIGMKENGYLYEMIPIDKPQRLKRGQQSHSLRCQPYDSDLDPDPRI